MTTTDEPTQPSEKPGLLESILALQARGEAQVADLKKAQAELDELIQLPPSGAIDITFDELGLIASMHIDPDARAGLDGAAVVRDINVAIARADRPAPSAPSGGPGSPEAAEGAVAAMFASVMSAALAGAVPEPVVFANDFGTVRVTTMFGEIQSVDCDHTWIESASDDSMAEEVTRVANLAARADDPMGRRKETN